MRDLLPLRSFTGFHGCLARTSDRMLIRRRLGRPKTPGQGGDFAGTGGASGTGGTRPILERRSSKRRRRADRTPPKACAATRFSPSASGGPTAAPAAGCSASATPICAPITILAPARPHRRRRPRVRFGHPTTVVQRSGRRRSSRLLGRRYQNHGDGVRFWEPVRQHLLRGGFSAMCQVLGHCQGRR